MFVVTAQSGDGEELGFIVEDTADAMRQRLYDYVSDLVVCPHTAVLGDPTIGFLIVQDHDDHVDEVILSPVHWVEEGSIR